MTVTLVDSKNRKLKLDFDEVFELVAVLNAEPERAIQCIVQERWGGRLGATALKKLVAMYKEYEEELMEYYGD